MDKHQTMRVEVEYKPTFETQRELAKELTKLVNLVPFWRKNRALEIVHRYVEIESKCEVFSVDNSKHTDASNG